MTDRPLSRQPACHLCQHETHIFACEWCLCDHDIAPGIYA